MEHFYQGCSYYLASTGEQVNGLDLSQFDDLNISDQEKPEAGEVENEATEPASKNADPKLAKMRKELGAIGGAGHFFGDDREIWKGGVRNGVDRVKIRKVLQLLSIGERKINLKFYCSRDWDVSAAGWKLQFKTALPQEGGDGNYYLWLSNKDGGVPFKAVVEQLDCNVGKVHHRHELVSEKDAKGQLVVHEDGPLGAFSRYNITLLEPSEVEGMRKEFKSMGTIGEAGHSLAKNLIGNGAARHQNFSNVLKQLALGKRNFDLEFRVGVLDDGENCEITEGDWKLRFTLAGLLPPIVMAQNVRISREQTFWLSFGLSKKGEGVPFKAVTEGVPFVSKKEENSHSVKIETAPFGSLRVNVELL